MKPIPGPRRCTACDGKGWNWMAPDGVNPFNVKLPYLADMVEKRTCFHCHGTGDRSYNMRTTDDQ
jgi:hypothetical protein